MRSFQIQLIGASALLLAAVSPAHAQSITFGQKPRPAAASPAVPSEMAVEPRMFAQPERAANVSPSSALTAGAEVSFLIVEENEPTRVIIADSGELEIPGGLGRVSVAGFRVEKRLPYYRLKRRLIGEKEHQIHPMRS